MSQNFTKQSLWYLNEFFLVLISFLLWILFAFLYPPNWDVNIDGTQYVFSVALASTQTSPSPSILLITISILKFLNKMIIFRDGNPNPTNFLDPERIRIRNLNCGFGLLIITFLAFKTKFGFHNIFHAYFRLG